MIEFRFSKNMEDYREANDIKFTVVKVELLNERQLHNKYPKFKLTTTTRVFEGSNCEDYFNKVVSTVKLSNNTFRVKSGNGQVSGGLITIL